MKTEFNFKNGERVLFDNGKFAGSGVILGSASTAAAIIGTTYIIDVEQSNVPIPSKAYPFQAVVMQEVFITQAKLN